MNIENIKFSHYHFSDDEVLYDTASEDLKCEDSIQATDHYIVVVDRVSTDEAKNIIYHFKAFLDRIKQNSVYSNYIEYRLVYCNSIDCRDFTPILIVDKITWDFLHGLFFGVSIVEELENF